MPRTVVVESPSRRRELILVSRAVFHIVFWSAVVIAVERGASGSRALPGSGDAEVAAPAVREEITSGELSPAEQQVDRALRAAVPGLESARSSTGAWPDVAELGGRRWRVVREGVVVNYLGLPDASANGSTFVLTIVEPEPGIPVDPQAVTDEIHHRLPDGTLLHVSIWMAPGIRDLAAPLAAPAPEDGWQRVKE